MTPRKMLVLGTIVGLLIVGIASSEIPGEPDLPYPESILSPTAGDEQLLGEQLLDANGNGVYEPPSPFAPQSPDPTVAMPLAEQFSGRIGLDARNGFNSAATFATGSNFDLFRETLISLGLTLVPLATFTETDLAELDALVLSQPYAQSGPGYTADERSAIHAFVASGGGLLAHADGGSGFTGGAPSLDLLVAPFGVSFASSPTDGSGREITGFFTHMVTSGINAIGVDYHRPIIFHSGPAIDLTHGGGSDNALATVDGIGGAGNVVLLSDTSLWIDPDLAVDTPITFRDNLQLLRNIAQHIVSPVGVRVQPLGGLSATGFRGGPFDPFEIVYTVQNFTESALEYEISKSAAWITLDDGSGGPVDGPLTGIIDPLESTSVTVRIDSDASTLPVGDVADTIRFMNLSDGIQITTRRIDLRVLDPNRQQAIANGDFESGDLFGWTVLDQGSGSWTINDGTLNSSSPDGPIPPCGGNFSAMTIQNGPGRHTLVQEVELLPGFDRILLGWVDIIRNHAGIFQNPIQSFKVEIWDLNNAVLREVFSTQPGDPSLTGCNARSYDISEFAEQTIRIAFTQQDNLFFFNAHLDDITVILERTNEPPTADAQAEPEVECTGRDGGTAVLDGSNSSDPDSAPGTNSDIINFQWYEDYLLSAQVLLGTGETLETTLALGTHAVTLLVTDSAGNTDTADLSVLVSDTIAPSVSVSPIPPVLWPPNHRLQEIQMIVLAEDDCTVPAISLQSVTSDEPDDAEGNGDGRTTDDIQGVMPQADDVLFHLRAERAGAGNGRTYVMSYIATDVSGNAASAASAVEVPHDQASGTEPVMISVTHQAAGTLITWSGVPSANFYDVARGRLGEVRDEANLINLGVLNCVESRSLDLSTLGHEDAEIPAPGEAFFYLVAYNDGHSSSYGTETAAKSREPGAGGCD